MIAVRTPGLARENRLEIRIARQRKYYPERKYSRK